MRAILTCYFRDVRYNDDHINLFVSGFTLHTIMTILTCYFKDVRFNDGHINLLFLEMYVSMTVILTCYFRGVHYNDCHIELLL
jgi:hypothetical protein